MASRLELDGLYHAHAPRLDALGRQVVTGLLALAFLAAVLVSLVTTDQTRLTTGTGSAAAPMAGALAEASGLGMAVEQVIALSTRVEVVRGGGGGPALAQAEAQLEAGWGTLAMENERMAARAEVAERGRLPLMGARPPAPYGAGREEALVRSALTYVRGAVEMRDVMALERARALLEMARR